MAVPRDRRNPTKQVSLTGSATFYLRPAMKPEWKTAFIDLEIDACKCYGTILPYL
jgi:hypothetical protein